MSRASREESRVEIDRKVRVPLGVPRSKLTVPEIRGYKMRWINDLEGRMLQAEMGGYEYVQSHEIPGFVDKDIDNENRDLGTRISRVVDKTTGMKAYLMKIKTEFYEEDQKEKLKSIDEIDRAIRTGSFENSIDESKRYIPEKGRGIKID